MTRSVPLREARPPFGVDAADAGILDPHRRSAAASLGEKAILEAVPDLGLRRDMRPPGDPVVAGAGMFGIDEEREGASSHRRPVGQAKHGLRIGGPVHPVAGKVPAIGGLGLRR